MLVETRFARVSDYFSALLKADALRAVLDAREVVEVSSAERLCRVCASSGLTLSPRDYVSAWLDEDPGAMRLDMDAAALLDALASTDLGASLALAPRLRAAIEFQFASDAGLDAVRQEREDSPRSIASALLKACGATMPLDHLSASVACFDADILTRQYLEREGRPMKRLGTLLIRLDR